MGFGLVLMGKCSLLSSAFLLHLRLVQDTSVIIQRSLTAACDLSCITLLQAAFAFQLMCMGREAVLMFEIAHQGSPLHMTEVLTLMSGQECRSGHC